MQITLHKRIQLNSEQAYLRLKKEEKRPDIQEYLEGKKKFEPIMEKRIKEYLKNIGVYDEHYQLTQLGYQAKEKGAIFSPEEGKYQMYSTVNDKFFGNKIVYLSRKETLRKKERLYDVQFDANNQHFMLPTKDNDFAQIKLTKQHVIASETGETQELDFYWFATDNLQTSYYQFVGTLTDENYNHQKRKNEKKHIEIKKEKILAEESIADYINYILPNWDEKEQRYKVHFDEINDTEKKCFRRKEHYITWNDFSVTLKDINLKPYDVYEAEQWRNWLLNQKVEEDYIGADDFDSEMLAIQDHPAFQSIEFADISSKEFIERAKSKKAKWHLTAPLDLNPNSKQYALIQTLEKGDSYSFVEIVENLGISSEEDYAYLFFYDKYVCNYWQQSSAKALLDTIRCEKKHIITQTEKFRNCNYLSQECCEIKLHNCEQLSSDKPPHDRYLILIKQNGSKDVWTVSSSLDYIRFNREQNEPIDKNSIGTIFQNVTFTKLDTKSLPRELSHFIEQENQNEN